MILFWEVRETHKEGIKEIKLRSKLKSKVFQKIRTPENSHIFVL